MIMKSAQEASKVQFGSNFKPFEKILWNESKTKWK